MGSVTIRKIDEATKAWLKKRAGLAGRSVESELRHLIAEERMRDEGTTADDPSQQPGEGFGSYLFRLSRPGGDFDLERDRIPHDGIDL